LVVRLGLCLPRRPGRFHTDDAAAPDLHRLNRAMAAPCWPAPGETGDMMEEVVFERRRA
jgi:hypothetical protein